MEPFCARRKSAPPSIENCAEQLVSTIPLVMRALRKEMRAHRPEELSIPQFRTMIYLERHVGVSISDVADHHGLALSSTSQLIDGLVKRQYVTREIAEGDRRRAIVSLTAHGKTILASAREQAQARMAERLALLSPEELQTLATVLQAFDRIFARG